MRLSTGIIRNRLKYHVPTPSHTAYLPRRLLLLVFYLPDGRLPACHVHVSLDDARVHVISESLIDARCLLVYCLVERVWGVLVPLGKGDER